MGLDMRTKKILLEETAKRYCWASKKEKTKIIDEFTATTGYNRKYAIHVLKNKAVLHTSAFNNVKKVSVKIINKPRKKRMYNPYYGDDVRHEVIRLWEYSTWLCSKRLVVFIRDNLAYFAEQFSYSDDLKMKLGKISSVLKPEIARCSVKGISTTRPAKNLNQLIPIRTFFDWDERKPGFLELDTVAHCGTSTAGEYINTLTVTDIYSGWTENRALLNKAHRWVKKAIEDTKTKLPFVMKGLHSDNGGEFKNMQVLGWCQENGIDFSRSRPYKKNDNCFVEQKNDSVVRRVIGYYRFEGEQSLRLMQELYEVYGCLVNYFFPSMKIISKERIDKKVIKKYDTAKTPYNRLLESPDVPEKEKAELQRRKAALDLSELLAKVMELQKALIATAVPWRNKK